MNKLVPLMNKFRILLGVIFLLLFTISAFYLSQQFSKKSKKQSCTQEAKVCPDGSTVSRTGPNCEFAPCPNEKINRAPNSLNWKTYINTQFGFKFKYPPDGVVKNVLNAAVSNNSDWLKSTFLYLRIDSSNLIIDYSGGNTYGTIRGLTGDLQQAINNF